MTRHMSTLARLLPPEPYARARNRASSPPGADPRTTREEVTLLTSSPDCSGCHAAINAPGFAFESFDAVGQVRTMENGVAVDTTGTFELDGVEVSFDDGGELVELLAESSEARTCYAGRMLEFTLGHGLVAEEAGFRNTLGSQPLAARDLLAEITTTAVFMKRAPNEVAP